MTRWLLLALLLAAPAVAGDLSVEVRTAAGKPVRDAVVTLYPAKPVPAKAGGSYQVVQQNIQFDPFVLVVPVGSDVTFPNRDDIRHQVYSFSPAKTFELKLYARDTTHIVHFDKPGIVPLGCNIHDRMTAFIDVVDTAYAAKTGADGVARFPGVPAGAVTVKVWHPYLRAPGGLTQRAASVGAGAQAERFVVALRAPPTMLDTY